ncbi:hypothetical protein NLN82_27870, partial [Citrobacter portucalensis]|nr:hypothetical protein [Citrobacter portucalensis]
GQIPDMSSFSSVASYDSLRLWLPGGILLQAGKERIANTGKSDFNFPVPYPEGHYFIVGVPLMIGSNTSSAYLVNLEHLSDSMFSAFGWYIMPSNASQHAIDMTTTAADFYWIAIGK